MIALKKTKCSFLLAADTLQAPKPFVNDSLARHLTVGDHFQLNCSASYPDGTQVSLEWEIPHPLGIDVSNTFC